MPTDFVLALQDSLFFCYLVCQFSPALLRANTRGAWASSGVSVIQVVSFTKRDRLTKSN